MGKTTVVLNLPDELVNHFRQFAAAGSRTLEEVMAETLAAHQPELDDYEKLLAPLAAYSDDQLWQVVNDTLTEPETKRYRLSIEKRSSGYLSPDEQHEIDRLVEKIELQMLLRSEAVVILKDRGHDVSRFIGRKAHDIYS